MEEIVAGRYLRDAKGGEIDAKRTSQIATVDGSGGRKRNDGFRVQCGRKLLFDIPSSACRPLLPPSRDANGVGCPGTLKALAPQRFLGLYCN